MILTAKTRGRIRNHLFLQNEIFHLNRRNFGFDSAQSFWEFTNARKYTGNSLLENIPFFDIPISLFESAHVTLCDTFGLPLWAAIVSVVVLYRIASIPLYANHKRTLVRTQFLMASKESELQSMFKNLMKGNMKEFHTIRANKIQFKDHIKLALLSSIFFIFDLACVNRIFRNIDSFPNKEGFLWLSDLSLPDPYYTLPLICFFFTTIIVINSQTMGRRTTINVPLLLFQLSIPLFITFFFRLSIPAAPFLCMTTNFGMVALKSCVFKYSRAIRTYYNIPNSKPKILPSSISAKDLKE